MARRSSENKAATASPEGAVTAAEQRDNQEVGVAQSEKGPVVHGDPDVFNAPDGGDLSLHPKDQQPAGYKG